MKTETADALCAALDWNEETFKRRKGYRGVKKKKSMPAVEITGDLTTLMVNIATAAASLAVAGGPKAFDEYPLREFIREVSRMRIDNVTESTFIVY